MKCFGVDEEDVLGNCCKMVFFEDMPLGSNLLRVVSVRASCLESRHRERSVATRSNVDVGAKHSCKKNHGYFEALIKKCFAPNSEGSLKTIVIIRRSQRPFSEA